jgi:YbbR domain-containing protein
MDIEAFFQWVKQALTQDLGLKAMAMAFAVGFFGYVHGQEDVGQRTIPISVISLPPESGQRELMTKIPPAIHITLRGSSRAMTDLIQDGIPPVEVDLREGYPTEIEFLREMFLLPSQLELIVVDPPRLSLDWEEVVTRQVPLQASVTGKLADGYIIKGEPKIEPDKISVRGPRSHVEVIQFARLAAYNVTGLTAGSFPRRIAIDAPPERVNFLGSPAATVIVEVKLRESEKLFSGLKVQVIGPRGTSILPRTVDVTVVGPPDVVRALRVEQVIPLVDLVASKKWSPEENSSGSASLPIVVHLSGVQVSVQPPEATLKW